MPRPKYREEDFPPPGTVFVAPAGDGRLAAGRVLRREVAGGAMSALVAATPWIDDKPPSLDLPILRETLILTHHKWNGRPEVFWAQEPMPAEFTILGQIDVSPEDAAAICYSYGGWWSAPHQRLTQWRWDHDREALLHEEAIQEANQAEARRQLAAAREERLKSLTLDSLVDREWFASWTAADSNLPVDECRSILARLVSDLRAAPKLTQAIVKKLLKQSVMDFNRLDASQPFIATIEREDISEAYEQIMAAARYPQLADFVDRWREW